MFEQRPRSEIELIESMDEGAAEMAAASWKLDDRWAREAPSCTPAWLWQESARRERLLEEEVERTHRDRYLSLDWNEERSILYLQGRFGAEQGAALERAVTSAAENVVGGGRRGRILPSALLRALRFRDRGACRFPGCERKKWLKAHHIEHWGRGGPTDLGNLVLLCHAHHRLMHEGGWGIRGRPGVDLRFHDPIGRGLMNVGESALVA